MKPRELAGFDAGNYDAINYETGAKDLRKAPRESDRISRDNRLVSLIDAAKGRCDPSPEDSLQAAEIVTAFKVIGVIPRPCVRCNQNLSGQGEDRVAIVRYRAGIPEAFVYCPGCFSALNVELDPDPWFASQPELDRRIWQLRKEGLTQPEIGAELGVTQQTVSAVLARMTEQFSRSRRQTGYD
jgi:hypothetical protein